MKTKKRRTSRASMSDDERKYQRLKRKIEASRRRTAEGRCTPLEAPSYRRFKALVENSRV